MAVDGGEPGNLIAVGMLHLLMALYLGQVALDAKQAAVVLGLNPSTVRALMREGRLPGARMVGAKWLAPLPILAEVLEPTPKAPSIARGLQALGRSEALSRRRHAASHRMASPLVAQPALPLPGIFLNGEGGGRSSGGRCPFSAVGEQQVGQRRLDGRVVWHLIAIEACTYGICGQSQVHTVLDSWIETIKQRLGLLDAFFVVPLGGGVHGHRGRSWQGLVDRSKVEGANG